MRDLPIADAAVRPTIEVENLRLAIGGVPLLDIPGFALTGPGPTLILGPNGAGKSLLLRCLHGLIEADGGTIRQGGAPMTATHRAHQAMVFQKPVLLRRSVAANLDFVLKRRGLDRKARAERIAHLLDEGGLAGKARQSARSLSGGEAQRLAILRALATGADTLFLDEPTSALDPAATHAIEAMIRRATRRGTRVIMVTHDIGQARRLARDVVLMQAGRVVEHAAAHDFFDTPRSEAARQYLSGALVF